MEQKKGKYEREEIFDPALIRLLGDRYEDISNLGRDVHLTPVSEDVADADFAEVDPGDANSLWGRVKMPILFAGLVGFVGVSQHLGLMDASIAVPVMCLCSACFGWNVRWR